MPNDPDNFELTPVVKEAEYTMLVRVDTNDADYVSELFEITQSELDQMLPLIRAIKAKTEEMWKTGAWFHNYDRWSESPEPQFAVKTLYPEFTEDDFELLDEYCPHPIDGFHTIESIEIAPKVQWTKVF